MCITSGPFAHWIVTTLSPHFLRHDYANGNYIPSLTPINVMTDAISDAKKYDDFLLDLEVHHSPLHLVVKGEQGNPYPMCSPKNPIFFSHHIFIDMAWYNWQMK
ncbi:hypothetical protein DSO57_1024031 [Entomophthora muscae]|uniref:Uncharacterized protein n=1 Tax=Entomophthora muscae TaxID=34485 RepID=A0ACC2UBR6_9FUNG|nr:hypothetical protein DSO57_1024031 [Entomophthora muscae]